MPALGSLTMQAVDIGPHEHVLALSGELDEAGGAELERWLAAAFDNGAAAVIVDVRSLRPVDATLLRIVGDAARRARSTGGRLLVAADSPELLRVLRTTGLDRFVTVRASLAAAVDSALGRCA